MYSYDFETFDLGLTEPLPTDVFGHVQTTDHYPMTSSTHMGEFRWGKKNAFFVAASIVRVLLYRGSEMYGRREIKIFKIVSYIEVLKESKGKSGAYAMKRVAAGAISLVLGFSSLRNAQTILFGPQFSPLVQAPVFYTWVEWGAPYGRTVVSARPNEHFQQSGPPKSADWFPCLRENPDGTREFRTRDLSIPSPIRSGVAPHWRYGFYGVECIPIDNSKLDLSNRSTDISGFSLDRSWHFSVYKRWSCFKRVRGSQPSQEAIRSFQTAACRMFFWDICQRSVVISNCKLHYLKIQ